MKDTTDVLVPKYVYTLVIFVMVGLNVNQWTMKPSVKCLHVQKDASVKDFLSFVEKLSIC